MLQESVPVQRLLLIAAAGALGTAARYLLGIWIVQRLGGGFPYATVAVNLAGCFLIGAAIPAGMAHGWSDTARLALTVGLLGGFTTYSSFNHETIRLIQTGAPGAALLNVGLTVVGGLAMGWLGLLAGSAMRLR